MSGTGDIVRWLVGLGRRLRAAGVDVGAVRLQTALRALEVVTLDDPEQVYWALRCALCSRPEHLAVFDSIIAGSELPGGSSGARSSSAREDSDGESDLPAEVSALMLNDPTTPSAEHADAGEDVGRRASAEERLRELDFGDYGDDELLEARRLIDQVRWSLPRRRTRRLVPAAHPRRLDLRRTMQHTVRTGGTPVRRFWRSEGSTPRRIVLLLDISGSMAMYSRPLVMFAHAAVRTSRRLEVFTFGTRLTRVTEALDHWDPEQALGVAGGHVRDWSGGTRIGESIRAFNDEWGRRGMSRGAVIVIVSDGWEREDATRLGEEMRRLARSAHTVVWVNPVAGDPDYEPVAAGMAAALPSVDLFLAGHNLNAIARLVDVLEAIPDARHARGRGSRRSAIQR